VVPGSLWWEFLQLLVAEDISEGLVLFWDSFVHLNSLDGGFLASYSGGKYCFVGVVSLEYYRQLLIVDPAFCPIDAWLGAREPGVSQDDLVIA
jgi:hypothetical protein